MRYRAPERSYAYIYPELMNLEQIAYFFRYELRDPLPSAA